MMSKNGRIFINGWTAVESIRTYLSFSPAQSFFCSAVYRRGDKCCDPSIHWLHVSICVRAFFCFFLVWKEIRETFVKPGKVLRQSRFTLRVNWAFIPRMASDKNVMFKLYGYFRWFDSKMAAEWANHTSQCFSHVPASRSSVRKLGSCWFAKYCRWMIGTCLTPRCCGAHPLLGMHRNKLLVNDHNLEITVTVFYKVNATSCPTLF